MSESSEQEPEYGRVMPFVVCATQGGPYEDKAFVAGARFGAIDERMKRRESIRGFEPPALVPQLDLLAMRYGYTIVTVSYNDEWAEVSLTPGFPPEPTP